MKKTRKLNPVSKTRRFDNQSFRLEFTTKSKTNADRNAKTLRSRGFKIRIIPLKGRYAIYKCSKG